VRFEWDPRKATANLRKHGVSFDEAKSVFSDDVAQSWADNAHSDVEDRFIIIGTSVVGRLLVVCYCFRGNDSIRIFSSRKANAAEVQLYFGR
jgi:uncharacterized DUF497 family protein